MKISEKKTVYISKTIVVHHLGKCVDNERRARKGKKTKQLLMDFGFFVKIVKYTFYVYNVYNLIKDFII